MSAQVYMITRPRISRDPNLQTNTRLFHLDSLRRMSRDVYG